MTKHETLNIVCARGAPREDLPGGRPPTGPLAPPPLLLLVLSPDGQIIEANQAALAAYGYTREQLRTMTFADLAAPGPLGTPPLPAPDAPAVPFATVHQRQDGQRFPVEVDLTRVTLGGTRLLVSLVRDLTDQYRVAEALEQSHRRFQALFTHALDSMLLADDTGRYVEANPAACALTGYSRAALLQRYIWDLTPLPVQARGQALWQQFLAQGTQQGEYTLRRQDGTLVDVEYRAVAHIVPGLHLSVLHDITARKRAEAALQQLQATLTQRVAERTAALHQEMAERQRLERDAQRMQHFTLLGRLAAGVSHEIRNPLGAIVLHVDLLEEELREAAPEGAARVAETLTEIRTHLGRLDDLVQDYLSLVRVAQMVRTPQDLGVVLRAWAAEWQALARARGITCHLEGLETLGVLAVHPATLRRALLNLVQNALDAMAAPGTLTVVGHRTATHIEIQVRDTGSGIPAEQLSRLFEPLYTTKPGGTGLGLYLVQEIVAAHGGKVRVESVLGQGTTCTVALPLPVAARPHSTPEGVPRLPPP